MSNTYIFNLIFSKIHNYLFTINKLYKSGLLNYYLPYFLLKIKK